MGAQRGPRFSTRARALCDDHAAHHTERDHVHRTRTLRDAHGGEIRAARDHPAAADAADAGLGASGVSSTPIRAQPGSAALVLLGRCGAATTPGTPLETSC